MKRAAASTKPDGGSVGGGGVPGGRPKPKTLAKVGSKT